MQELLDLGGPVGAMVAAREVEGESGRLLKPGGSQAKTQELGGGVRVEFAAVECVQGLAEEL